MGRIGKTTRCPRQSLPEAVSYDSDQARTRELRHLKARVEELEEENMQLRDALFSAIESITGRTATIGEYEVYTPHVDVRRVEEWHGALDGGGDENA